MDQYNFKNKIKISSLIKDEYGNTDDGGGNMFNNLVSEQCWDERETDEENKCTSKKPLTGNHTIRPHHFLVATPLQDLRLTDLQQISNIHGHLLNGGIVKLFYVPQAASIF